MKINRSSTRAFSALELAVVICIFAALVLLILPRLARPRRYGPYFVCINNQKQIGVAYRIFSGDNNDKWPTELFATRTNSGWRQFINFTNAGPYCWSNYAIIQNELGQSPNSFTLPSRQSLSISRPDSQNPREGPPPPALSSDREAIEVALYSALTKDKPRVCRIKSTASLREFWVSEALIPEVEQNSNLKVLEQPTAMAFDNNGNLF